MGLFSRNSGAAEPTRTASDVQHRLVSPGLPDSHARQLAYELLVGTGLGIALRGPGDVSDCFSTVSGISPVLLESEAVGAGFGSLRQDAGLWMAWSGPAGSAIVYCGLPDSDAGFLLRHITDPVMSARGPFEGRLISLGSSSDAALVEIINSGDLVPIWDLPGLGHLRPAETVLSEGFRALAASVREELLSHGGEEIEGGTIKLTIGTGDGRTQLVFVALQQRIHLLSPIARTADGVVPPALRSLDAGGYELDVLADLVMLTETIDDRVPVTMTVEVVVSRIIALARYADSVEASVSLRDDL